MAFGRKDRNKRQLFETRSHSWAEVGLTRQLSRAAVRRARIELALLIPLVAGMLVVYDHRRAIFGTGSTTPVRVVTVIGLVILGWAFARSVGRSLGPVLFRRMDPASAGTMGFLFRLVTMGVALIVALRIGGLKPQELAAGGAFTAVVFGLAAQQTLGNLIAGTVLLSARPFRVGDRVRMMGGNVGGQVEGIVSSLGLLYTVLTDGEDEIMVPNSTVLGLAVSPLREPDAVDLRARLRAGANPSDLQDLLEAEIDVPLRDRPRITLEEIDGEEVVVRIQATPIVSSDGPKLASEVLRAVASETRRADPAEAPAGASGPGS